MKTLFASLVALGLFAGAASAADIGTRLFGGLNDSAPRSIFDDIRDSAPRSIFDDLRDSAPRSIFDDLRDSAPRAPGGMI
jgi:hypothetical protein